MAARLDYGYLSTAPGQLNIAEIVCLIGALISVAFTSRLYCELVDSFHYVYPELSTLVVRSIFQSFALFCLTITIAILIVHIYGVRFLGRNFFYINQICLIFNIIMATMMIIIGICAGFWEDKLRRTPGISRRGYYDNRYQYIYGELTHPRPGAAAAAAIFAILAGILFLIEACSRPMLNTGARPDRTLYTIPVATNTKFSGERIIPIERIRSSNIPIRV